MIALCLAPSVLAAQNTCEPGDKEVRALEFRGNRELSDDDLALRVATTPSSWIRRNLRIGGTKRCLNPRVLPRDVAGLRGYYRERGFYQVAVESQVDSISPSAVRVVFNITEGAPTLLTSYRVTGLDGLRDSADIMRRLRLRVGDRWDVGLFQADMDSIVSRLRNAGYYFATIEPHSERTAATRTAEADLHVIPNKPARFGEPDITVSPAPGRDSAEQQISDATVKRLLGIRTGQLFSDDAIRDAQRNLFQLATYRQIEVQTKVDSLQPSGDTIVLYDVRLTEDLMHALDTEYGWATLDCFRVRLQYVDKNVLSSARRLELTGSATKLGYGHPLRSNAIRDLCEVDLGKSLGIQDDQFSDSVHYFLGATLRQPRLLGTRVTPALSIYTERRGEFTAYLRNTFLGGEASAARDLGDRMPLRLGYSLEFGRTFAPSAALCALFNRCDPDSQRLVTEKATLGVTSLSFARIRTDDALAPTRGTTARFEFRSAQPFMATSKARSFNKGTGDVAYYAAIGRNVLVLRLRSGAVLGRKLDVRDTTDFIPPQERLYAGGPTSVRGFQQNELGDVVYIARAREVQITVTPPSAPGADTTFRFHVSEHPDTLSNPERTVPLGGNALVVTNVEFRTRLPFLLPDLVQFTAFVDGGDVWSRGGEIDFKLTPGLGIRVSTPVGPVQMNVAHNPHERLAGSLYHNPDVSTLACATPGNTIQYTRQPGGGFAQVGNAPCPRFGPPPRTGLRRLTFTFSIGSDF